MERPEDARLAGAVDKLEALVARLERVLGEREVTVADVTEPETDDAPHPARVKADAAMFYTLSASDIAAELGLPKSKIAMLLNRTGLDLVRRKPELWSADIFQKTKRRLWHPQTVAYLRRVIIDPNHPDRKAGGPYAARLLDECRTLLT